MPAQTGDDTRLPAIIFLGIADHVRCGKLPFPYGAVDLFQLSQQKILPVFPWPCNSLRWVVAINQAQLLAQKEHTAQILLQDADGRIAVTVNVNLTLEIGAAVPGAAEDKPEDGAVSIEAHAVEWSIVDFAIEGMIPAPGVYSVRLAAGDIDAVIGRVHFPYVPSRPFTADQIRAIESNPDSVKAVRMAITCKSCKEGILAYSALEKLPSQEAEGAVWQHDLPEEFACTCGQTKQTLRFIRESLHGLIGTDAIHLSGLHSYERRYAHSHIVEVVNDFRDLVANASQERPVQEFLEQHPVLLAQFHARKVFTKQSIIGKYETDFVILDSHGLLRFIELERPNLKLFKVDGHPTAKLMHAYGQVRDWLNEYSKHRAAVLDAMGLKPEEVMGVNGLVIAGRSGDTCKEHLQRHVMAPPYPDIGFQTIDALADSLGAMSRRFA